LFTQPPHANPTPPHQHIIKTVQQGGLRISVGYGKAGITDSAKYIGLLKNVVYCYSKGKKVLTSRPELTDKLTKITRILQTLGTKEKVFSTTIWPIAIKLQGGRSLGPRVCRTVPQRANAAGSPKRYSGPGNSPHRISTSLSARILGMVKTAQRLLRIATGSIYFSGDAASWQASTELYARVEIIIWKATVSPRELVPIIRAILE